MNALEGIAIGIMALILASVVGLTINVVADAIAGVSEVMIPLIIVEPEPNQNLVWV